MRRDLPTDLGKQVDALQDYVNGYFEFVRMNPIVDEQPLTMAVNDEGLIVQMRENLTATVLAGQLIVGPAVVLPAPDAEGNVTGFDNPSATKMLAAIGVINEPPF